MKVAILFGPLCLSFRKSLDFEGIWDDARGLTGSELGCVRIAEELQAQGHEVAIHTVSAQTDFHGIAIKPLDAPIEADVVVAINEPDLLRAAPAGAFRVVCYWLNDASYNRVGFDEHVDLFLSPSEPHLRQVFKNEDWRKVEKTPEFPNGKAIFTPDPAKWMALPLGCDPDRYRVAPSDYECNHVCDADCGYNESTGRARHCEHECRGECYDAFALEKIPGRVIYASSPDRGLHLLLQEWPAIKRAVPHASLHIFYRLEPWLRQFDSTPYFPPIEPLRDRSAYVEECLRRFKEHGGMDVTLRDSVSRRTIEREMAQAEVLAYPCNTTTWSEGFSCTVLEACAARACPVISSCDALGEVYADIDPVARVPGWLDTWRERVILALTDPSVRAAENDKAYNLASGLTWKLYAERLMKEVEKRRA